MIKHFGSAKHTNGKRCNRRGASYPWQNIIQSKSIANH